MNQLSHILSIYNSQIHTSTFFWTPKNLCVHLHSLIETFDYSNFHCNLAMTMSFIYLLYLITSNIQLLCELFEELFWALNLSTSVDAILVFGCNAMLAGHF